MTRRFSLAAWHLDGQSPNTDKGALLFKGDSNVQFSLDDGNPLYAQIGVGHLSLNNWGLCAVSATHTLCVRLSSRWAKSNPSHLIAAKYSTFANRRP